VFGAGEPIPANIAQDGLLRINRMLGSWALAPQLIPTISRVVWPLIAGQGGPSNPYFLGPTAPAGSFLTPTRPNRLEGVGLLLNASTPPIEVPRAYYTDDEYKAIYVKDLSNLLFTGVYYTPTTPNGTINLWPVPSTNLNSLVLYRLEQIGKFADLTTTSYTFPDGYEEAIISNFVLKWAPANGVAVTLDMRDTAVKSLATIKRANLKMTELELDSMFAQDRRARYNIMTGTGGG
jgi:hypothetical protein